MASTSQTLLGTVRAVIEWSSGFLLIVLLTGVFAEGLLCYSCFSLNYRSQVAPRNNPPPEPQNQKNLSEIVSILRRLTSGVPPLSDGCADVSLTSQPSFISAPRTICKGYSPLCAKVAFLHKGERVVVRDCYSRLVKRHLPTLAPPQHGFCPEGHLIRNITRFAGNATLCTCGSHLCNSSPEFSFLLAIFLFFGFICS